MTLLSSTLVRLEAAPLPDPIVKLGIGHLVDSARRQLDRAPAGVEAAFAEAMSQRRVAEHTEAANDQHYELPAAFFTRVLGPRLKYSSAYYETQDTSLAEAEAAALARTAAFAELADGQAILELGCGWGSLSLWMAERFAGSQVTAVSNSHSQRAFIEAEARARGLGNLTVVTADMNLFQTQRRFDRIVSVEMFEHMANWRALLGRAASPRLRCSGAGTRSWRPP